MCGGLGAHFTVCLNKGLICGNHKFGGSHLLMENQEEVLKIAKEKANLVVKVIDSCIKNEKSIDK